MKKVFFTMMLAMVSSAWMANEASNWCMPSVRTLTEPWIEVNGTFQAEGFPCEPDELCPPCLTIVLVTSDKTYYLVTDDGQLIEYLDTIQLGTKATVSGTPFTHGNYNYIQVSKVDLVALTEFQERLLGQWQVYKQDVTDVYWDEEGVPSRETRTFNIDTEETCARIWHIEAKHIYEAGPCIDIRYPLPTYAVTALDNGTWQLTIPDLYDLFVNDTTEAPSGTTPIIIHKLDENNMEWEYSIYGGDEGPRTYYQYLWRLPHTEPLRLNSLCDEWNVMGVHTYFTTNSYHTIHYLLTSDTLIGQKRYVKLEADGTYKGALHEGSDADIYFIPANSTHEYLLYAFHAQKGDTLYNVWMGAAKTPLEGETVIVSDIVGTTLRMYNILLASHAQEAQPYDYDNVWIEGIGFAGGGPDGPEQSWWAQGLTLCAYKDGNQIYAQNVNGSSCEFNRVPESHNDLIMGKWQVFKMEETLDTITNTVIFIDEANNNDNDNKDIKGDSITIEMNDVCIFQDSTMYIHSQKHSVGFDTNLISPYFYHLFVTSEDDIWNLEVYTSDSVGKNITITNLTEDEMEMSYYINYKGIETIRHTYHLYLKRCQTESDTIPLYIKDGPGTSTVEPVDPNQIIVTLNGDKLTIQEYLGIEIGYVLTKAPSGNNMPARNRKMASDTFSESVSIHLTESGLYTLTLTSPEWSYSIVGTFEYDAPQGIESIETVPATQKILRDGQLFIRKGDRIYTVQGIELHE